MPRERKRKWRGLERQSIFRNGPIPLSQCMLRQVEKCSHFDIAKAFSSWTTRDRVSIGTKPFFHRSETCQTIFLPPPYPIIVFGKMFNPMQRVSVRASIKITTRRISHIGNVTRIELLVVFVVVIIYFHPRICIIFLRFFPLRFHSENLHLYRLYNVMLYVYIYIY